MYTISIRKSWHDGDEKYNNTNDMIYTKYHIYEFLYNSHTALFENIMSCRERIVTIIYEFTSNMHILNQRHNKYLDVTIESSNFINLDLETLEINKLLSLFPAFFSRNIKIEQHKITLSLYSTSSPRLVYCISLLLMLMKYNNHTIHKYFNKDCKEFDKKVFINECITTGTFTPSIDNFISYIYLYNNNIFNYLHPQSSSGPGDLVLKNILQVTDEVRNYLEEFKDTIGFFLRKHYNINMKTYKKGDATDCDHFIEEKFINLLVLFNLIS